MFHAFKSILTLTVRRAPSSNSLDRLICSRCTEYRKNCVQNCKLNFCRFSRISRRYFFERIDRGRIDLLWSRHSVCKTRIGASNRAYRLYRNVWLSFLGHQDDDKEIVREPRSNSEGTISSLRNTDSGTKEPEREDLVTRFDRVVRGDPDQAFQVWRLPVKTSSLSSRILKKNLESFSRGDIKTRWEIFGDRLDRSFFRREKKENWLKSLVAKKIYIDVYLLPKV